MKNLLPKFHLCIVQFVASIHQIDFGIIQHRLVTQHSCILNIHLSRSDLVPDIIYRQLGIIDVIFKFQDSFLSLFEGVA